ncbi:hypothetical protein ACD578_27680 (plasmid) [Microvirga sp. RSM25]|uniref:hypothetical protein n=1 Tax=Microvirga sp. RSM25 TaxID=3273802 RepID=UPI00384F9378
MKRELEPEQHSSVSSGALYGCLIGIALTVFHPIHDTLTDDIPEGALTHPIFDVIAGDLGGAILFAVTTALRNRPDRRR